MVQDKKISAKFKKKMYREKRIYKQLPQYMVKIIQINLNRNMRNKEIHSDVIIQMMTFFS